MVEARELRSRGGHLALGRARRPQLNSGVSPPPRCSADLPLIVDLRATNSAAHHGRSLQRLIRRSMCPTSRMRRPDSGGQRDREAFGGPWCTRLRHEPPRRRPDMDRERHHGCRRGGWHEPIAPDARRRIEVVRSARARGLPVQGGLTSVAAGSADGIMIGAWRRLLLAGSPLRMVGRDAAAEHWR